MAYKLVCFDMDGVLFKDINFWMELHKSFGTYEEGVRLTEQYLHTNYNKLVDEVVGRLWKGKEATPYFSLVNSLEYLPGVPEMFTYVESQDYITAIVSASSLDVAKRVQNDYGIDHLFANQLIIKEGKVAGEFVWPIGAGKDKKAEIIRHLCTDLGISAKEVIYIGDSDTDIEAFKEVGLAIAFNSSSDALQKVATHVVDSHNLVDVIPILKMYR